MIDPKTSDAADASLSETSAADLPVHVEPATPATDPSAMPPAADGLPGVATPAAAAPAPTTRAKTKGVADLVFVVDVSGSMAPCIDALRKNIEVFIDSLSRGDGNTTTPVK